MRIKGEDIRALLERYDLYRGDIRRIIILPHELQIFTLARTEDGYPFIREGEVAEDVEIHEVIAPW